METSNFKRKVKKKRGPKVKVVTTSGCHKEVSIEECAEQDSCRECPYFDRCPRLAT